MQYRFYAAALCGLMLAFLSCRKEKQDHQYDNRPVQDARGNSLLRLVNLVGHNQVLAGGDTLTNYTAYPPGYPGEELYPGTPFFPENGRLGQTWSVPRQFFHAGKLQLMTERFAVQGARDTLALDVKEDGTAAKDIFLLQPEWVADKRLPRIVELPRSVTAPAKAGYFKVRLVNLAQAIRPQSEPIDDLTKPLTLAFADGTPVAPATSAVGVGKASEYVELPYGTYQFKVLSPEGYQVTAGQGSSLEFTSILDPATATLTKGAIGRPHTVSTHLTYSPVRTFQPGGVYTIVVATDQFTIPYYNGQSGETTVAYMNAFRILSDISEPANLNYARIQAVNALPGEGAVSVQLDGQNLAQLGFGKPSEYALRIRGTVRIDATDAKGTVIASVNADLEPNMNYTAWVFRGANGKAAINVVSNNLSGGWYVGGNGADGSLDRRQHKYPFHIRFLNFCEDLPYVSFTEDNGQPFGSESSINLQPGVAATNVPYIRLFQQKEAFQIMAYRSSPGVVPGSWIREVPVLKGADFIARKALYVRGELPNLEPGVFTVALIGKLNGASPEAQKARMIIVKHTK